MIIFIINKKKSIFTINCLVYKMWKKCVKNAQRKISISQNPKWLLQIANFIRNPKTSHLLAQKTNKKKNIEILTFWGAGTSILCFKNGILLFTYCGLQLTFLRSGLRLGSGASMGLGGSRFLSCSKLTGLRASTSSSGTPLSPPSAADSWDRFGNGCRRGTVTSLVFALEIN